MSKLLYGSIDFSKLLELAKAGNKAFSKADNGKIYLNLNGCRLAEVAKK